MLYVLYAEVKCTYFEDRGRGRKFVVSVGSFLPTYPIRWWVLMCDASNNYYAKPPKSDTTELAVKMGEIRFCTLFDGRSMSESKPYAVHRLPGASHTQASRTVP